MKERNITLMGVRALHPRGVPTEIRLSVALDYLNGGPIADTLLTRKQVVQLIRQCAAALEVVIEGDIT